MNHSKIATVHHARFTTLSHLFWWEKIRVVLELYVVLNSKLKEKNAKRQLYKALSLLKCLNISNA